MKFLCSEKLSEHKYKTPEGYLVCLNSVLARTGKQTYKRREIFGTDCRDAENEVEVDRTEEEVFSDKTLASFENKPLTIEHPEDDVRIDNYKDLAVGFARDIKRGKDNGQDVMLGTLIFTDADAIEAIESGEMTELSCGYDADIVDEDNPCQRNIRGNHIALCRQGRAGNARIVDSKVKDEKAFYFHFIAPDGKFKGKSLQHVIYANSKAEAEKQFLQLYPTLKKSEYNIEDSVRDSKVKDDSLQKGKTYVAKSGATLKVIDYECSFSDYNGDATVIITYDYVSASGKKSGRAKANSHDFWKMLTDKNLTGDSVRDDDDSTRQKLEQFVSKYPGKIHNNSVVKMYEGKYSCIVKEEDMTFVKNELNRMGFKNVRQSGGKHIVFEDSLMDVGLHQEQLAQSEYLEAKDRLNYLYEQRRKANASNYSGMHFEPEIAKLEKKIAKLKKDFGYALGDSMKDGKLVEVQPSTIMAFEGKVNGANIHIDSKGRTWTGRLHYQLSYDASKASFDTFVKELERLESWLESIGISVTFSANTDGKRHTAGFDIDKQWVKDSMESDYNAATRNLKSQAKKEMSDDSDYENIEFESSNKNLATNDVVTKYASLHGVSMKMNGSKPRLNFGGDWYEPERMRVADIGDGAAYFVRMKRVHDSMKDSKEDVLQKLRTARIHEGDTFEMRDGQYLVQIQNVGKDTIEIRKTGSASVKTSSWAWGRIWKNGTIVFNETEALNIIRDKMIQFMKTVRDSKGDK